MDDGHDYYYIDSGKLNQNNVLSKYLLPEGSMEEDVRSQGAYIISYDRLTATIYEVFYVYEGDYNDIEFVLSHADEIRELGANNKIAQRTRYATENGNIYVGYYGTGDTQLPPESSFIKPDLIIHNEENLYLEVVDYNYGNFADTVLTIEYLGVPSGASATLIIPLEDNQSTPYSTLLANNTESSFYVRHFDNDETGVRTYYILLDSLTTEASGDLKGQFINHFKAINSKFIPGEDLIIRATLHSAMAQKEGSAQGQVNSMFAHTVDEGNSTYSVGISNPRHLQNLSYEVSGTNIAPVEVDGNGFAIVKATILNDLD